MTNNKAIRKLMCLVGNKSHMVRVISYKNTGDYLWGTEMFLYDEFIEMLKF